MLTLQLLRTWTVPSCTVSSMVSPKDFQLTPALASMRPSAGTTRSMVKPHSDKASRHRSNSRAVDTAYWRLSS
ncbi:hypothetical protein [Thauera sp.]|uniref:hypothetical protein n=1 Tax=Thauera sp. TaxID=1905334 RepID=UPI002BC7ADA8|nr:hypothetical protein [Thauera sp.]HRP23227.1 hypothetical protein [Thauera sp.]